VDPIAVALLAALAGGAGGEAGRQAWAGLTALVRRPFQRTTLEGEETRALSTGEVELVRLDQDPDDLVRAQELSTALAARAAVDAAFATELSRWHDEARRVRTGDGDVTNTVSGGTVHGPVLQGRDFSGTIHLGPPSPPASPR
jgi:hypothetical protein